MTEKESNNLYERISTIDNWNDTGLGIFMYPIATGAWYEIQVITADFIDDGPRPVFKLYSVGFTFNDEGEKLEFERTYLYKGFLEDCMKEADKDCSGNVHINGLQ